MTQSNSNVDWSAVFVHAGAGYHSTANEPLHLRACASACKAAMALLRNGGSAVDGVEMALKCLEDNEITNCGFGSNLTVDGSVECDASIMEENGRCGAVGAVDGFKNPSAMARMLLDNSRRPLSLKRVPPVLLVGDGAKTYAREHKFPVIDNKHLISHSAQSRWAKWQRELINASQDSHKRQSSQSPSRLGRGSLSSVPRRAHSQAERPQATRTTSADKEHVGDLVTDTVGAICVDRWGRVAAGSSSGGIGMKYRGRVGPAALVGVGTWVKVSEAGLVVAATCSGTGEQMAHTMIGSKAVDRIFEEDDEMDGLKKAIDVDFMGAPIVTESVLSAAIGIMAVKFERTGTDRRIHFCFGHTTDSMALAHISGNMKEPLTDMSRNKRNPSACYAGHVVKATIRGASQK